MQFVNVNNEPWPDATVVREIKPIEKPGSPDPSSKISRIVTSDQAFLCVVAYFKELPIGVSIPEKWVQKIPEGYKIEAILKFAWDGLDMDWEDLKAGYNFKNYLNPEDSNLIAAEIYNCII